jgi:hypothetical protein
MESTMKRLGLAFAIAMAVITAPGLAGPVVAGEQVPFKGSLQGDVTIVPLVPPSVFADVDATGTATHLGRFTLDIPHTVDRGKMTAKGRYVFTAANGDEVHADFDGVSTLTDVPNVLAIVETATITGGTGRFAGATGSFTAYRLFDRAAGTTIGYFEGTISAPGN